MECSNHGQNIIRKNLEQIEKLIQNSLYKCKISTFYVSNEYHAQFERNISKFCGPHLVASFQYTTLIRS